MKPSTLPIEESSYKKSILPNGIRVVSEEIPYVRSISVGVWINVGSRDERDQKNGISHFLEHMVFKGTERYSARQIATSLEGTGGYLNAFTTKEHTCYYARILDDHLPEALDVISDLVRYPRFDGREMEKEKKVILEEMRNNEDDPDELIYDHFDGTVFHDHPLANPILGRSANIKAFSINDLEQYMGGHYIPSGIVVAAAGNLKHDTLVAITEKYFGGIPRKRTASKRQTGPRRFRPGRYVIERPITQAHICTGAVGYGIHSRNRYPLMILNAVLGEGMGSRLFQNIREKYGFAYSVYSFANLLSDTGNFGVYIGTDAKSIDKTIALAYKELEKLKSEPVGRAELNRTKAHLRGMTVLGLESMTNRMMRLGSGEIYFEGHSAIQGILEAIEAVSAEEVEDVAKRLFRIDKFSTVIIKPSGESAPLPHKAVA